ncbi:hypothetical protein C8R41DRAFT_147396 [Lentinula lateritia]|uniref:Uncharacterized protein n=1 Tax=Lentinula lateritia TaxID=40482 RepID=A0ABQ8VQV8_9AGAR|nr:hypothetical protein C8R41DRAFT_147396 [Lentinula lateritia]
MYFHRFNRGLRFEAYFLLFLGLVAIAHAAVIPANSDSVIGHSEMAPTNAGLSKREDVQVTFLEPTREYEKVQVKEELLPTLRKAIKETIKEIEADVEVSISKGTLTAQHGSIRFEMNEAMSHYDQGQILFLHGSDKFQIWLSSSKFGIEKGSRLPHTKTFSVPSNFVQYMPKVSKRIPNTYY